MEGAVWMGKKLTQDIERVCQTVDLLTQEYHTRVSDLNPVLGSTLPKDLSSLQRAAHWLLTALSSSLVELYDSAVTSLESAIFHQEEADRRVMEASSIA